METHIIPGTNTVLRITPNTDPFVVTKRIVRDALDGRMTRGQLAERAAVSPDTIKNWLTGQTKRPQMATINAVLKVLGYRLAVIASATRVN